MTHRRQYACAILLIASACCAGCSSSSSPQTIKVVTPPPGTYTYRFHVANLSALDTSKAHYFLWLRFIGDSSWYPIPLGASSFVQDSTDFTGTAKLAYFPDSISTAYLSIEPSSAPAAPSSILLAGAFQASISSAHLNTTNAGGVGDYSNAQATATFTTKSVDTNSVKNEFYLLRFVNDIPQSSCANFPTAPQGWCYGLWVTDSNFYPLHQFFYGVFTNPDSSDTNPTNNDYLFPGGYNSAPLNDPGAKLEITLEPSFSSIASGPSPLRILWGQLYQFIGFDDTLALRNSWSSRAPSGTLTIQ